MERREPTNLQAHINNQLPLNLAQTPSHDLSDYIVTEANQDAFNYVTRVGVDSDSWPSHFCALVGPKSSGKTHLAKGWAERNRAIALTAESEVSSLKAGSLYYLDDVDGVDADDTKHYSDEQLFHLFNWAKEVGAFVLVTAHSSPSQWSRTLPDLKSRLAVVPVFMLKQPDDRLMQYVLLKLFSDKQLEVNSKVIDYLIPRVERSLSQLVSLVDQLDAAALATKRRVTVPLARTVLSNVEASG